MNFLINLENPWYKKCQKVFSLQVERLFPNAHVHFRSHLACFSTKFYEWCLKSAPKKWVTHLKRRWSSSCNRFLEWLCCIKTLPNAKLLWGGGGDYYYYYDMVPSAVHLEPCVCRTAWRFILLLEMMKRCPAIIKTDHTAEFKVPLCTKTAAASRFVSQLNSGLASAASSSSKDTQ